MGRIPGKPIKTRITYYARPEIVKIIDDMIRAGKFNNKSDVISAAILDYSHNQDMDYVRELEEKRAGTCPPMRVKERLSRRLPRDTTWIHIGFPVLRKISAALASTSKSLLRPLKPYFFKLGETARQIVLLVRLASATTRLVVSGFKARSLHSTEA